jgi:DNA-binding HxlR family transcriptional regulator
VVGLKWTLLIVRDLIEGPRRFTEIQRSLQRANPNMIAVRLRELEITEWLPVIEAPAYQARHPRWAADRESAADVRG